MSVKRFVETVSTGIVTDKITGKEYNCDMRISEELLELINTMSEENDQLKEKCKLISDMENTLIYMIDREKSDGDEYTAEVLRDLKDKYW